MKQCIEEKMDKESIENIDHNGAVYQMAMKECNQKQIDEVIKKKQQQQQQTLALNSRRWLHFPVVVGLFFENCYFEERLFFSWIEVLPHIRFFLS